MVKWASLWMLISSLLVFFIGCSGDASAIRDLARRYSFCSPSNATVVSSCRLSYRSALEGFGRTQITLLKLAVPRESLPEFLTSFPQGREPIVVPGPAQLDNFLLSKAAWWNLHTYSNVIYAELMPIATQDRGKLAIYLIQTQTNAWLFLKDHH